MLTEIKFKIAQWPVLLIGFVFIACSYSQELDEKKFTQENDAFQEQHRPQFHFSPPSMWMNDPNGMVYLNGEYHLFYQHYPDSTVWGPMHWGHAISKDLVHWEHMPIALYPDSLGYIFSGSAVVDKDNTSGLGSKDNPAMVAVFTYHDAEGEKAGKNDYQTQGIAYSVDHGRTWKKYAENPVLDNPGKRDFRDPKVFWHEPTSRWVMILAVDDHVKLYGSENLKSWEMLSEFGKDQGSHGGVWECPDLFPLKVEGQEPEQWVMLVSINPGGLHGGSATQYFIGDFDGKTFTNANPAEQTLWLDYGKDNYAGVTWSNIPDADGRRIFMGWMSNWQYADDVPTAPWRSAMTVARTLNLKNTPEGVRLISQPVEELASLRGKSLDINSQSVTEELDLSQQADFNISTSELTLTFDAIQENQDVGIELSNQKGQKLRVGFDEDQNQYYVDRTASGKEDFSPDFAGRHTAPRISSDKPLKMHLLIDVASVELFADDGEVVITDIFFPDEVYDQIKIYAENGTVQLTSGQLTELASIWKDASGSVKKEK